MLNQFTAEEISKAIANLQKSTKVCRELYLETGEDFYANKISKQEGRIKELETELNERKGND